MCDKVQKIVETNESLTLENQLLLVQIAESVKKREDYVSEHEGKKINFPQNSKATPGW